MVNDGRTKGGKRMKKKTTEEKYDKLWTGVQVLSDSSSRRLLCFLMGFCEHNKDFLEGVESGLAAYSTTEER